ncbi:hypothetical protein N9903_01900 [bacterium]|nr:hypothetical protein [bacterium]
MTILLASLGLGSFAVSRWIQTHKLTFFSIALSMMALSLFSAINERRKKQKNTGLIAFGLALLITAFLLSYNKIKYGYFI